jgi:nitroreductase
LITGQVNPEVLTKYVQNRRSIRNFRNRSVEKEKIEEILKPSASPLQA